MYLRRGWKTFARIHSLTAGLVLYFKLMEDGLLSVKVFGDFGTRLKCCVESSSDGDSDDGSLITHKYRGSIVASFDK